MSSNQDKRIRELEALLGGSDGTAPCCRLTRAEYLEHLSARAAALERGDQPPRLYLLDGGCTRTGGELCPEARAACQTILDRRQRLEQNTRHLIEAEL